MDSKCCCLYFNQKVETETKLPAVQIGPVLPREKNIVDIKQAPVAVAGQEPEIGKKSNVPGSLVRVI